MSSEGLGGARTIEKAVDLNRKFCLEEAELPE